MNTVLFFLAVLVINYIVFSAVFVSSDLWSKDFVGFRVMMGQPASDFASPPLITIIFACVSKFLFYLFCGMVNMLVSVFGGDEGVGLAVSLVFGILAGFINLTALPADVTSQIVRSVVLLIFSVGIYVIAAFLVSKRDMGGKRKK